MPNRKSQAGAKADSSTIAEDAGKVRRHNTNTIVSRRYSLSEKKARILYAAINAPIMDARIQILKRLRGVCHVTVYNEIDLLLYDLNRKAPQKALECFRRNDG